MGKKTGITLFTCDRCQKTEYIDAAEQLSTWREVSRITSDNVKTTWLLCPECAHLYREVAQAQDLKFNEFMKRDGE